ncbi:MAG: helix-turn-helix domain-containing protein [Clostridia bacterium]|nr:helix-turn-helix domain-containing protein [Clostridia bacterium]
MDQIKVGQFITRKRKEKNLTQEQLAERLNVSNKTISKWECGKCLPDYSIMEALCKELEVSIAQLLDGNEREGNPNYTQNEQVLKLIKDMEQLKKEKAIPKIYLSAIICAILGIALCLISTIFSGGKFEDFISGYFLGISIALILLSVFLIAYATVSAIKKNKRS